MQEQVVIEVITEKEAEPTKLLSKDPMANTTSQSRPS
jgi:hypothetical protein